jgi:phage terminase large subunit
MSLAAIEKLRLWREKPHVMVRELFGCTPDLWQDDVLAMFPTSPRIAMKACKGPGKTSVLAWLCWNFLLTRPRPKVAATSISGDNLSDGLWTEMAKWQAKSDLLRSRFTWTKTRISCNDAPEEWWMSARSWPKGGSTDQQSNTLAGLHADYLMFVIDEAGGIPDGVMAAAEAGLANAIDMPGHEAHIVMAGNPTHLEGPLYRACTTERSLWQVVEITSDPDDPKRTPRVSAEWARQQITKYGRDNPWVLINVFGKFPPSSLNALIGPDQVREAMQRVHREDAYGGAARILGVDVAREGDDKSVIFPRQGVVAWEPKVMRNADSLQGAGAVAHKWNEWTADACFVDNTGGFGAGWIDQLRVLGRTPIGIHFAGKAGDVQFFNKRAEMLWKACEWVKEGGALPDIPELLEEMTAHTYFFNKDQIQIEDKDQVKAKIGRSPDYFDGLGLTFAQPVMPMTPEARERRALSQTRKRHDPFARNRLS